MVGHQGDAEREGVGGDLLIQRASTALGRAWITSMQMLVSSKYRIGDAGGAMRMV
ncbi:MAG: hypothetical protein GW907_12580 [Betaproteobacteria bacterium]|nr:hypothetical protein [Betaproteobacteria bacterium]NCP83168.1 hypothetical protein [Rhodoferax sp.]NCS62100.1 hypothetical protein [Rhodoferax sp.]